jgi:hypothetical protein
MTERFVSPFARFFTSDLKTLAGAKLYFYENGTTTPKTIYQDPFKTTPHANPVIAGSLGYAADTFPPIFIDGTYTVELRNSAEVVQAGWPVNNVGGEQVEGSFDTYSAINIYNEGDIVTGSNGLYYVCQSNNVLNQDPTIPANQPTPWLELRMTNKYNPLSAYFVDDWVFYGGDWYVCIQNSVGNTPADPSAYWTIQWKTLDNLNDVLTLSGGGSITARYAQEITDSLTYTIPLANSVPTGTVFIAGKTDQFKGQNPVLQTQGGDVLRYGGGTDTEIRFSAPYYHFIRFKSNGSNEWSF